VVGLDTYFDQTINFFVFDERPRKNAGLGLGFGE
jgi:hypothetical protein